MVSSEDSAILKEALRLYNTKKPADLNAEIRSLLMSVSVRSGESDVVTTLLSLHKSTTSQDVETDICAALTSTKDPALAAQLVELIKDKTQIRPQDIIRWYAYLLRNKHTREAMWQWTVNNWDWLLYTFKASKSYDYIPRYAANFMNNKVWLERYKEFFEPMLSDPALNRTIEVGVKEIEARVKWRERDEVKITAWLNRNIK